MKKSILFLIVLLFSLLLITGCNLSPSSAIMEHSDSKIETQNAFEIEALDQLIELSHNIVYGKVESIEDFDGTTKKINVLITKELKGKTESDYIDVYEYEDFLEVGKEYLLFLEYWEDGLYPRPVYNVIRTHAFEVSNGKIVETKDSKKFIKGRSKNELEKFIASSPNVKVKSVPEKNIIEKTNSVEELINVSGHILHIIPREIIAENKYVKNVNVEILDEYKGEINKKLPLSLPSSIEVGKEYIIFLKGNEELDLATREGSVVSKEDSKLWDSVVSKLQVEVEILN